LEDSLITSLVDVDVDVHAVVLSNRASEIPPLVSVVVVVTQSTTFKEKNIESAGERGKHLSPTQAEPVIADVLICSPSVLTAKLKRTSSSVLLLRNVRNISGLAVMYETDASPGPLAAAIKMLAGPALEVPDALNLTTVRVTSSVLLS